MLLPFSVWEFSTGAMLKFDSLTLATLAYVLIFPSTLAYLFFNRGIALIGPNRAAPFFHLVPVFGSAMAILLLGEQPRLFHLVGYALVLAGVVIASRQGSAKSDFACPGRGAACNAAPQELGPMAPNDGPYGWVERSETHYLRQGGLSFALPTLHRQITPRGPWPGIHRPRCAACPTGCRVRGRWRARRTPPCR